MQSNQDEQAPYWSRAGLWSGIRYTLPMLPGTAVFGMAFGTVAAQKGLTLIEAALMSALVFGGASQLVAMEIWTNPMTWALVAPLALVTGVVNMRLLLMSASLRPWLGPLPAEQTYPALLLTTDATWLIAMRYRADGGSDASVLLGSGFTLWLLWVASERARISPRRADRRAGALRHRSHHADFLCRHAGAALARAAPRHPLAGRRPRGVARAISGAGLLVHHCRRDSGGREWGIYR